MSGIKYIRCRAPVLYLKVMGSANGRLKKSKSQRGKGFLALLALHSLKTVGRPYLERLPVQVTARLSLIP
jgi:hypothetical protein